MEPFYLLNKKIQKIIHEMKWENFRPIQDEAILHMINSPSDMIISAPTASGKTEAAFLPIISQIADNGKNSVKILYISPLKALINDQFSRIETLCKHIDFPITKWHGDANQSKKTTLIKNPAGILLITPESIESLFLNKTEYLGPLFKNLEYIVIDEIHSFIGNERGSQLKSLINRLKHTLEIHPYKIALSATISNLSDIAQWINPTNPDLVKIIEDNDKSKDTVGLIKCYKNIPPVAGVDKDEFSELKQELFKVIKQGKNLIFANAKMTLEEFCDSMQNIAKDNSFPNNFYIHHGSLAKNIREQCENLLKKESNISVFCTNTLELGIDIGNIDRVIFLAPPFSVASMVQRLGRCGRKENARKEFRFYIEENSIDDKSTMQEKLRVQLVQSIAIVELMLKGFSEPLDTKTFDYSTFAHQILSYLGQTGGANAPQIYHNIAEISFNSYFSKEDFIKILQNLNSEKIIYQMTDGIITLSKLGERIVENYEFYAAFMTPKDWKVVCNGKEIGQISGNNLLFLKEGSHFLLAGKRWEIIEFKNKIQTIVVKKAQGKKSIKFNGGTQNIHRAIHQKMFEIYETNYVPKYLSPISIPILKEGYENYKTYIKTSDSNILPVLEGTKIQNTIGLLFKYCGVDIEDGGIGFYSASEKNELIKILKTIDFSLIDKNSIINLIDRSLKYKKKFDYLLPDDILNKAYEQQCLDFDGARKFVENL
ncbi:MAG: DEAD/DEAH box helicase [Candidatus Gastranaerophilales bacterium]|nr:DEAD/DEAH box helicase [Candidatus Gastranaerophilales bacterium]